MRVDGGVCGEPGRDEHASTQSGGPRELAWGLADLLPAYPEQAVQDIEELLTNSLGAATSAQLREGRLGLLLEMVSRSDGEVPRVRDYMALRRERLEQRREQWPTASALHTAYGSFLAAVKAAMRLHHDGSGARVPHTHRHARHYTPYSRDEVIAALRRFHEDLGSWPRCELEYLTWGEAVRRAKRNGGHPDPRIPTAGPIKKLFGSFGRALELAGKTTPPAP